MDKQKMQIAVGFLYQHSKWQNITCTFSFFSVLVQAKGHVYPAIILLVTNLQLTVPSNNHSFRTCFNPFIFLSASCSQPIQVQCVGKEKTNERDVLNK